MEAPAEVKSLIASGARIFRLAKKEVAWLAGMGRRNAEPPSLAFFGYALMAVWLPFALWRIVRRMLPDEIRAFVQLLFAMVWGLFALLVAATEMFHPLLDLLGVPGHPFKIFALVIAIYKFCEAAHHGLRIIELLRRALVQKSKRRSAQLLIAIIGSAVLHGAAFWMVLHALV